MVDGEKVFCDGFGVFFREDGDNWPDVLDLSDLIGDFDGTGDRFSDFLLLTDCNEGIGVGGNTRADCSEVTDSEEVIVMDGPI